MKWWEIPQNCNCLFALDSDSEINKLEKRLYFSNKDNNNFINLSTNLNKVNKVLTYGLEGNLFNLYHALRIEGIILEINQTIAIPDESTWILVVKPLTPYSSLASGPDGTSNWGFEYRAAYEGNRQGWTFSNTLAENPLSGQNYQKLLTDIHKVDIMIDHISKTFITNNNYGIKIIESPINSFFTANNSFAFLKNLKYLSYNTSSWLPHVDIIAYGVFDKKLTEAELESVYTKINNDYYHSNTELNIMADLEVSKKFNTVLSNILKNPTDSLTIRENITENLQKNSSKIPLTLYTQQVLYKNLKDIFDQVLEEGEPVSIKLYLHEKVTGKLIKTTLSDSGGFFNFLNLNKDLEYVVTAHDNKYQFQSILKNYNK